MKRRWKKNWAETKNWKLSERKRKQKPEPEISLAVEPCILDTRGT